MAHGAWAVDIGGSGLRLQVGYAGRPGPVRTAPGVRIGSGGIDVAAPRVADARALLRRSWSDSLVPGGRPGVVVWSMRGLLFLADRAEVLRQVRPGWVRRTVVVSDAVANLVGALDDLARQTSSRSRPGQVLRRRTHHRGARPGRRLGRVWVASSSRVGFASKQFRSPSR